MNKKQIEEKIKDILLEKHSNKYRDWFFPKLIDALEFKSGVEIGVDKGEYSLTLLNRSRLERLYCVDTWQDDFGSDYKPDYYAKNGNVRFKQAEDTLNTKTRGTFKMIRSKSTTASKRFKYYSLDFCFIDGDHSLEGVYTDLKAWIHKVKIGGIVAGHDYKDGNGSGIKDYKGNQLPYHVKTVVDYFCQRYGYEPRPIGGRILSWYFIKDHSCQDDVDISSIGAATCSAEELEEVQKQLAQTCNDPNLMIVSDAHMRDINFFEIAEGKWPEMEF